MKKLNTRLNVGKYTKKRPFKRRKAADERANEAFANVPRITNDTVAEHREAVLSSARKYIYPLQHSKHRVVRISIMLFIVMVVAFFAYCGAALYKFQSTSSFIYGVTQVIPFPVAKAGPSWVSYDSYLFQLRRNMHYYQTQQLANFSSTDGKNQLTRLKQQAMAQVVKDAYVKQLAMNNSVSVSPQAVDNEVNLLQSENRLGSSHRVFDDVLQQYWGWNESEFKQELKQELLQQAVVAKLDMGTQQKASQTLAQLNHGADFSTLALQLSDDASTKASGGQYADPITRNDQSIAPQIVQQLFQMKPGQISSVINTGYSLEIVKCLSTTNSSVQAAHIEFVFKNINNYIDPLKSHNPPKYFLHE